MNFDIFHICSNMTRSFSSIYSQPLMTMRQFVENADESVNDDNLLTKYNEYKTKHRRTAVVEFFNQHKEEEW